MKVASQNHLREVLASDAPFVSNYSWCNTDGIYTGPSARDVADFCEAAHDDFRVGPLANEEARRLLASTALAVLRHAKEYDVIIGEDTSGRYPALVMGATINHVRTARGLTPVQRLFVSGRINNDYFLPRWQLNPGDKALVVTEYVHAGESTGRLYNLIMAQTDRAPDFAVLGGSPEFCAGRQDDATRRLSKVYAGHSSCDVKRADMHFEATPYETWKGVCKFSGDPHSEREAVGRRRQVAASRREAAIFSAALARFYLDSIEST
jgi:hypothetical protein